jgi:UDP-N-acetylglucosamine 2-epimerase (non-hydrolysing)
VLEGNLAMPSVKPLILIGTRPEAIKLAPVIAECQRRGAGLEVEVCLTGQHRGLLKPFVDYFDIPVHHNLKVIRARQDLSDLTARMLTRITTVLEEVQPDCVVGQGDTTTVMAGALAAFYRRIPFVHVEAGLRTYDSQHPWPEELNRRLVSVAASLHCAPTELAAERLRAEQVEEARIHVTGNTVVDALFATLAREKGRGRPWARKHARLGDRRMVLVTGHRRESFGAGLEAVCKGIRELAAARPEVEFVYPVHLNPNVREPVHRLLSGHPNIHLLQPVSYPEFVWLMDRCDLILSDSGGIQEEAPSLRKPVLVTRKTTERLEAVEIGAVELVGMDRERIVASVAGLLDDPAEYARRQADRNPYGDGQAAGRIVDLIQSRTW